MKKNRKKIVALWSAAMLLIGSMAGCGSGEQQSEPADKQQNEAANDQQSEAADGQQGEAPVQEELSGTITMAGSTSMEKLANALKEAFMEKYPNVTVTVEFTGSGAGIEALTAGSVDIGNSSRNLKEEELAAGAVENIVAIDGIAVVTDPANTVTDLTKDQLIAVYKGEITNWSELGGADEPIVVIGREAGSGTRGAFEELLGIEDVCAYANELDSTGAVIAKVASTPGAIGYASLDAIDDSVTAVSLEGVAPTVENIKAGSYFLSRPFVMATMGEISAQNELIQAFFAYLTGDEGRAVVEAVGLITVD